MIEGSVFKIIDTSSNKLINKIGILGKSIKNIKKDLSSGQGLTVAFFSQTVTKQDVQCITNYLNQVKHGTPVVQAWNSSMRGATVAGKQALLAIKNGELTLEELTKSTNTSRLATIGLTVAQTALNTVITLGISWALTTAITKFKEWAEASKKAAEAARESTKDTSDNLKQYGERIQNIKILQPSVSLRRTKYTITAARAVRLWSFEQQNKQTKAGVSDLEFKVDAPAIFSMKFNFFLLA